METADLFSLCDPTGKGYLCLEDLRRVCPQLAEKELAYVFYQMDTSENGKVSRTEFMASFEKVLQAGETSGGYKGLKRRASIVQPMMQRPPLIQIRETVYDSEPGRAKIDNLPWY